MSSLFEVVYNGGTSRSSDKTLILTHDEAQANETFDKKRLKMKQGYIYLYKGDAVVREKIVIPQ